MTARGAFPGPSHVLEQKKDTEMNLNEFDYDLPKELIAQDPLEDRSSSRLLVLDKKTGAWEHRI